MSPVLSIAMRTSGLPECGDPGRGHKLAELSCDHGVSSRSWAAVMISQPGEAIRNPNSTSPYSVRGLAARLYPAAALSHGVDGGAEGMRNCGLWKMRGAPPFHRGETDWGSNYDIYK
jgi:hypothetical protein